MFYSADFNGGPVSSLLTVPDSFSWYSTHSVKGWVCMDFAIRAKVCNPSTKQVITLPYVCEPELASSTYFCVNSFGFDPLTMQFKVLNSWGVRGKQTEYRVFTLGVDHEWRVLDAGPYCFPQRESICIDGFVYFRSWCTEYREDGAVLVEFDVRSESFNLIELPEGAPFDNSNSDLIEYKGVPAIFDYQMADDNFVSIWDFSIDGWEMYTRFCSLIGLKTPEGDQRFHVAGTFRENELLLVPRKRMSQNVLVIHWTPSDLSDYRMSVITGLPPYEPYTFTDIITFTGYEESILQAA